MPPPICTVCEQAAAVLLSTRLDTGASFATCEEHTLVAGVAIISEAVGVDVSDYVYSHLEAVSDDQEAGEAPEEAATGPEEAEVQESPPEAREAREATPKPPGRTRRTSSRSGPRAGADNGAASEKPAIAHSE